ncbi:MAG: cobalamin-dependent protein, partial [Bdellovibrionales bacterium]
MAKIILSTLNSTYQHSSFGLRYLRANLQDLREDSAIVEFTIAQKPEDIAEKILSESPLILGFGVYIWNTQETLKVIQIIKKVAPEIVIVLGGPEVSYEAEGQDIVLASDYVIQG